MADTKLVPAVGVVDMGEPTIIDVDRTAVRFTNWDGIPDGMVPVLAMARFTIGGLGPTGSLTSMHDTASPVAVAPDADPAGYTSSPWFYDNLLGESGESAVADLSIPSAHGRYSELHISDNVKLEDVEVRLLCIPAER